jgi:hypothetical protein
MITKKTVLILGAGASHHAGYPLGSDLVNEILNRITKNEYDSEIAKNHADGLLPLYYRLSRSNPGSIDTFLEANPDLVDLGKLLIADCLKSKEIEGQLFPPNRSDWYPRLYRALAGTKPESVGEAPLTIVTFNYDRSLETYLTQSMMANYHNVGLSLADATAILRKLTILHPHGILGVYPDIPYNISLGSTPLSTIANGIKIIHELPDAGRTFCAPEFDRANYALRHAERIYIMGFGFHDDNIRRFQFFSPDALKGKELFATCSHIGRDKTRLIARLEKYGILDHHLRRTECDALFWQVPGFDE